MISPSVGTLFMIGNTHKEKSITDNSRNNYSINDYNIFIFNIKEIFYESQKYQNIFYFKK